MPRATFMAPNAAEVDTGAQSSSSSPSGKWEETVLHTFGVKNGDGDGPFAGLILDTTGNLYGTTYGGGNQCGSSSCGTVYELSPRAGGRLERNCPAPF